jgi:hypothetical protein
VRLTDVLPCLWHECPNQDQMSSKDDQETPIKSSPSESLRRISACDDLELIRILLAENSGIGLPMTEPKAGPITEAKA